MYSTVNGNVQLIMLKLLSVEQKKTWQIKIQFYKFLTLLTFWIFVNLSLWFLTDVDTEHDNLWRHCRHFVAEAVFIYTIHVSGKSVLAIGFSFSRVDRFTIWPNNLHKSFTVTISSS